MNGIGPAGDQSSKTNAKAARVASAKIQGYPTPTDAFAFIYDGTLEGLLCAIFETYRQKLVPSEISTEENLQLRLGQQPLTVPTSPAIAQRVKNGICRTCGGSTFDAIRIAFLSDEPDKGTHICSFVRYAMHEKGNVLGQLAHPCVEPLVALHKFVMNERHYLMQFLRFREMQGGVWFAACNPKANVVPILMDWFAARFNTQPFIIYDEVHHLAGVSQKGAWTLVKSDALSLPEETADEALMADAWKRFYDAVAIHDRYNPELRRSFMPKRFWKNITEVADEVPGNTLRNA